MSAARLGRRHALFASAVVGVLVVVLVAVLATRSTSPGSVAPTGLLGKPAPAVSGDNIVTGRPVSLRALHGKYVVVDFFASWCAPCTEEAPQLEQFLFQHRKANDVAVLGVVYDDSAANARRFLASIGATWPAIADSNYAVALSYGVDDPPQSFVVGPGGRVLARIVGGVTASTLNQVVSAAQEADQ